MNFAVIIVEGLPNGIDHAGQAFVADAVKAGIAVETQRGTTDFGDQIDFPTIPNISNEAFDEGTRQINGGLFFFKFGQGHGRGGGASWTGACGGAGRGSWRIRVQRSNVVVVGR